MERLPPSGPGADDQPRLGRCRQPLRPRRLRALPLRRHRGRPTRGPHVLGHARPRGWPTSGVRPGRGRSRPHRRRRPRPPPGPSHGVFTGDILFIGGTPIIWDGPVQNWVGRLRPHPGLRLSEVIVPGHGPLTGVDGGAGDGRLPPLRPRRGRRSATTAGLSATEAAWDIDLGPYADWGEAGAHRPQRRRRLPRPRPRRARGRAVGARPDGARFGAGLDVSPSRSTADARQLARP